jgi:hypothetical protein
MVRKYSTKKSFEYYSPACNHLSNLADVHDDYKVYNNCQELITDFEANYSKTTQDIINFIKHIIDPNRKNKYLADVQFIADPYYESEKKDLDIYDIDYKNEKECHLNWFKNHFVASENSTLHAYDYVALFILNANEITDHKLMIGKLNTTESTKDKIYIEDLQDEIELLNVINIASGTNDVGYIINQKLPLFHKHSDFSFIGNNARRNVLTIRIKQL